MTEHKTRICPEQAEVTAEEKQFNAEEKKEKGGDRNGEAAGRARPAEAEFVHPEGGLGWVVMLASMLCNGSVFGIQNAFCILFVYLLQEFGSEKDPDLRFRTANRKVADERLTDEGKSSSSEIKRSSSLPRLLNFCGVQMKES